MPSNNSSALKFRPEADDDEDDRGPLSRFVSIELPDEAVKFLNEVMRLTGDTRESLFRNALGLYKLGVDARLDGNRLAIVDSADEVVQDIALP
jgi:hypothetical protein